MYCHNCGKEIDDGVNYCPYCGAKQERTQRPFSREFVKPEEPLEATETGINGYNVLCMIGFGLGLFSIFRPFLGIVAAIVSGIGLSNAKKTGEKGRNYAKIGMIVGIVTFVLYLVLFLMAVLLQFNIIGSFGHVFDEVIHHTL